MGGGGGARPPGVRPSVASVGPSKGVGVTANAAAQRELLAGRRVAQMQRALVSVQLTTSWSCVSANKQTRRRKK